MTGNYGTCMQEGTIRGKMVELHAFFAIRKKDFVHFCAGALLLGMGFPVALLFFLCGLLFGKYMSSDLRGLATLCGGVSAAAVLVFAVPLCCAFLNPQGVFGFFEMAKGHDISVMDLFDPVISFGLLLVFGAFVLVAHDLIREVFRAKGGRMAAWSHRADELGMVLELSVQQKRVMSVKPGAPFHVADLMDTLKELPGWDSGLPEPEDDMINEQDTGDTPRGPQGVESSGATPAADDPESHGQEEEEDSTKPDSARGHRGLPPRGGGLHAPGGGGGPHARPGGGRTRANTEPGGEKQNPSLGSFRPSNLPDHKGNALDAYVLHAKSRLLSSTAVKKSSAAVPIRFRYFFKRILACCRKAPGSCGVLVCVALLRAALPRLWVGFYFGKPFLPEPYQGGTITVFVIWTFLCTFLVSSIWLLTFNSSLVAYKHHVLQAQLVSGLISPERRMEYVMGTLSKIHDEEKARALAAKLPVLDLKKLQNVLAFWRLREFVQLDQLHEQMSLEILVSIELVYVMLLLFFAITDTFMRFTAHNEAVVTAALPTAVVDIMTIFGMVAMAMGAAFKINDTQDAIRKELVEARHDVILQIARSKAANGEDTHELEFVERLITHMIEKIEINDYKQKILFGTEVTAGKAAGVGVSVLAGLATTASHIYRIVILHHESTAQEGHLDATSDVFNFPIVKTEPAFALLQQAWIGWGQGFLSAAHAHVH